MTREEAVELVATYIQALKSGDYSSVSFSPSVSFLGPLHDEPLQGKEAVVTFLSEVSSGIKDVRINQYVIDGSDLLVLGAMLGAPVRSYRGYQLLWNSWTESRTAQPAKTRCAPYYLRDPDRSSPNTRLYNSPPESYHSQSWYERRLACRRVRAGVSSLHLDTSFYNPSRLGANHDTHIADYPRSSCRATPGGL